MSARTLSIFTATAIAIAIAPPVAAAEEMGVPLVQTATSLGKADEMATISAVTVVRSREGPIVSS